MFSLLTATFLALAIGSAPRLTYAASTPCTGTISSFDDVDDAVKCTTVNINSFTVPAGETLALKLATGATVNMMGDVSFGNKTWDGPLFEVSGSDIQFNGNGFTFNGNGPFYWDGQGGNGGVTKPAPMMRCVDLAVAMGGGSFTLLSIQGQDFWRLHRECFRLRSIFRPLNNK
ncbi:hypothetical protein EIP86_005416 [Pleurotus ostreatoroseus]|nr:hypothetical protein EIP86_005416 [Pleurotus ostreatoroseus]